MMSVHDVVIVGLSGMFLTGVVVILMIGLWWYALLWGKRHGIKEEKVRG